MANELAEKQMSYEEMIDTLNGLVFGTFDRTTPKEREALGMAINLLNNSDKDYISRKSVLEGKVIHQSCDGVEIINGYAVPVEYIEQLPSIQPKYKKAIEDIKAELKSKVFSEDWVDNVVYLDDCLKIIDKYTVESEDIISEDITKAGSQIEMLVDGTWIKGTVVEGYRYQDGIVTIETADGHRYWCGQDRTDIYRRNNC